METHVCLSKIDREKKRDWGINICEEENRNRTDKIYESTAVKKTKIPKIIKSSYPEFEQ